MTSKKLPEPNSDDEAATDNEADAVPQGDTPLSPEVIKIVSTLSTKDEENPACTEKESLEEEIKKMISKISSFELEPSSGKTVTEGQGDAEALEAAPEARAEIGESQAAPDLLLERPSSEEWQFQESKEDIAAWEEAVELEVQIIDPALDENPTVYYREKVSPYTSSTESFSDGILMNECICTHSSPEVKELGPTELQFPKHVDSFSTTTASDELELEALAICTSMVVDIMSKVEETIIANETNASLQIETNMTHVNMSQINENVMHDEIINEILISLETPIELHKTHINASIINTIKPSSVEHIFDQRSKEESEEEDLYDIESINVYSEDILNLHPQDISTVYDSQMSSQRVLSSVCQNGSTVLGLETCEKIEETNASGLTLKNTAEVTAPNLSFKSLGILTGEAMAMTTTAGQEICSADTEVDESLPIKEKECFDLTVIKSKDYTQKNPNSLSVNSEYLKEHLESFTGSADTNYKVGNQVQSCDDIYLRSAEISDSTEILDNTFGRTEVPPTASVRSLDSFSEIYYKNTESEETKYQLGQREKLALSTKMDIKTLPIVKHEDPYENEMTGGISSAPASTEADQCRETENRSHALAPLEKKEVKVADVYSLEANDTIDLFASISTIIKNGFEPSEMAKTDEVLYKRTQSSQNLMQSSSHSTQEDKEIHQRSEKYLEIPFRYSQDLRSNRRSPRDRLNKRDYISERKTKTNNLQKPGSSRDHRDGRKKDDFDSNLYSRKKVIPGETPNGKVCKSWKFGSKIKKLISSIKRKL